MSSDNPDITAADIVSDVEARLGNTNLSATDYLPWVSYAYQKVYHAIVSAGQQAKEVFFGNLTTLTLVNGTAEYSLETYIPRYGGIIKVEIKYGGTSDEYQPCRRLPSITNYHNTQDKVSTSYQSKESPYYYLLQDTIGFIPTPPATDTGTAYAKVWYIKRPYQIDESTDVIDIPYRYQYLIADYVQAKAIQAENESYGESINIERDFDRRLEKITEDVTNEFGEYEGTDSIQVMGGSKLFSNPLRRV